MSNHADNSDVFYCSNNPAVLHWLRYLSQYYYTNNAHIAVFIHKNTHADGKGANNRDKYFHQILSNDGGVYTNAWFLFPPKHCFARLYFSGHFFTKPFRYS